MGTNAPGETLRMLHIPLFFFPSTHTQHMWRCTQTHETKWIPESNSMESEQEVWWKQSSRILGQQRTFKLQTQRDTDHHGESDENLNFSTLQKALIAALVPCWINRDTRWDDVRLVFIFFSWQSLRVEKWRKYVDAFTQPALRSLPTLSFYHSTRAAALKHQSVWCNHPRTRGEGAKETNHAGKLAQEISKFLNMDVNQRGFPVW